MEDTGKLLYHTRATLIANVPENWRLAYYNTRDQNKKDIEKKLFAERPTDPKRIEQIIGNDTWTRFNCDICCEPVEEMVNLSDKYEVNPETINACKNCLTKALALFPKESDNG